MGIYVFDLDGTLVDSMPYYGAVMLRTLDEEGIAYGDDMINIVTPLGYRKTAEYYVTLGARSTADELVHTFQTRLLHEYQHNIPPKEGVPEFLRAHAAAGDRLFVLTASPHEATEAVLGHHGLLDLFEVVWSVEDFGLSKSGTELFERVAALIGCKPEEINYFEDNPIALGNAHAVGYHTYGVADDANIAKLDTVREHSDVYVNSFKELL